MHHRRTRSSLNDTAPSVMSSCTATISKAPAMGHGTTRTNVKNSTSSATTASTNQSSGTSDDEADGEDADATNDDKVKPIDNAPSAALGNIKIEDDPSNNAEEKTGDEQAGHGSEAEGDDAASVSDFSIAEDDDDYTALDMISISSGDLHVQKGESTFIEQALSGDADWASELEHRDAALPTNIDWNNHLTYQETPRSGLYDEFTDFAGVEPASPLSHVNSSAVQPPTYPFSYKDSDPPLRRPLFPLSDADIVDSFDRSSSSSSSTTSSPRSVAYAAEEDSLSQSAGSVTAGSQNDSDTEDEDLTAEIEARARRAELRKKKERRRKQASAPKTLKLRPKPVEASQRVSVMRAFRVNPRKPTAVTVMTDRGCFLKVLEPRDNSFKISWVTGRLRPSPVDTTPMSSAYALAMQSSMFRMLHCPNSPSLSFQRNKRAMASGFHANLMLNSPGLLPVPAMDGLEVEFGEATDQDITDLFLDLDNESVADCDSDYGSTPGTMTKRVAEVEEEEDSRSEASHYQTPTPLPRLDEASENGHAPSMMSSDGADEVMSDAIKTPATPTITRPRKRTIENVDEELHSPTKRHRSHVTGQSITA